MKPSLVSTIARQVGAVPDGPTRRQFLKTTLAAGAALMLGGRPAAGRAASPRVLVIGAGFGGLSCGYQLQQAGADVRILEARNRIGGRVLSLDKFIPGNVVEGGAELIGSNHPTWVAYAKLFGLELRELTSPHDDESPILLGGKRYSGTELEKLWEGLDRTLQLMNADARQVNLEQPWASAQAAKWDATNLSQAAARWDVRDRLRHAALTVLANDGATWPEQASYLACLSTIAGGGFEVFWTESEIYRCVGGNQTLAFKLAESIGSNRIDLNTPRDAYPMPWCRCHGAHRFRPKARSRSGRPDRSSQYLGSFSSRARASSRLSPDDRTSHQILGQSRPAFLDGQRIAPRFAHRHPDRLHLGGYGCPTAGREGSGLPHRLFRGTGRSGLPRRPGGGA